MDAQTPSIHGPLSRVKGEGMSEPKTVAKTLDEVAPGLFHYSVHDERIDHVSDAFALVERGKAVLVDPLPIDDASLARLGAVEAIIIATPSHQRSAWRYRRQLKVKVHAPRGAVGLDEKPDAEFGDGDRLPGGWRAVHAPGPSSFHHALHLDRGAGVLLLTDLVLNKPQGLVFLSDDYMDDPALARRSAGRLQDLKFGIVGFGHGAPLARDAARALSELVRKDARQSKK
jgi:glyoxylase-like metal-dependent hydrolase (beta-lactamase superfamily II)